MGKFVYLVEHWHTLNDGCMIPSVIGIFDTEEGAIIACTEQEDFYKN